MCLGKALYANAYNHNKEYDLFKTQQKVTLLQMKRKLHAVSKKSQDFDLFLA